MKTNWMKIAGTSFALCLAVTLSPKATGAESDGNLLELDVNVLTDKEDTAEVLDVKAEDVPVVGTVSVELPSEKENGSAVLNATVEDSAVGNLNADVLYEESPERASGTEEKSGVAGVTLDESPVGDVQADVLHEESSEGASSTEEKSGVAGVTLDESPVGDVQADVLYEEYTEGASGTEEKSGVADVSVQESLPDTDAAENEENASSQNPSEEAAEPKKDGGLGLNLNNLPLLGDLHVGLLEHSDDDEAKSGSLINVGLKGGILEDVNIDVLGQSSADGTEQGSLASVNLNNGLTQDVTVDVVGGKQTDGTFDGGVVDVNASDLPILEQTHIGVLDRHEATDGETTAVTGGVVSADLSNDLLDDVSVDVIGGNAVVTEDGYVSNGGVVDVNASDLPILEQTHIGVLDRHEATDGETTAVTGGVVSADLS
ncbi:hypothetical protein, partial [Bhargavaea ullalensis]